MYRTEFYYKIGLYLAILLLMVAIIAVIISKIVKWDEGKLILKSNLFINKK